MTTLSEAATALAELDSAITQQKNVAQISVDGQTVSYQSLREILDARDYWKMEVARLSGVRKPITTQSIAGGW